MFLLHVWDAFEIFFTVVIYYNYYYLKYLFLYTDLLFLVYQLISPLPPDRKKCVK